MSVDGNHIKRVSDDTASQLYQEGWRYVPKSIWKEKVRDIEKPQEEETSTKKKSNKMSKSQKRHMRKSNK
tara:strand:+ start:336 stop:545 length:210 start_codon:yes stop_codon:yes gene_type:complete